VHIVVTIKQVPDPDIPPSHFKVDEAARRVVPPAQTGPVMNGYDANALEAALQLKAAHGGKVTAVSLGPVEARETLKRAIAMGADSAVHVNDPVFEQADALVVARALAAAIRKLEPADLVLSGRQASDTDAGQVGLGVGELLGLPAISPAQKIEIADGEARVERMIEDGYQVVEVALPALIAVSSEMNEPRYPPLKGIMAASKAQIPVWSAADLGLSAVDLRPSTALTRLYRETRESRVELIEADSPAAAGEALATKLREAKLI
jgi:electron transfer flavoprotein beta subunit